MNSPKTRTPQDLVNNSPLARRINGAAYKIARQYGADYDDARSEITLAILERYAQEPGFLEDNAIAYITTHGVWRARDALRRECVQFVNCTVDGDAPVGDDGDATVLELTSGDWSWSDAEREFAVARALDVLDEEDRRIARMYAMGYTSTEISNKVGIARRTVYYRLNNPIRDALAEQVYA